MPQNYIALDTNCILDLADDIGWMLELHHGIRGKFPLVIPPTVVQELAWFVKSNHKNKGSSARKALENLRPVWGIEPYDLKSVGHGIVEANTYEVFKRNLLPPEETNDAQIIVECGLHDHIGMLITSDRHLLDMDKTNFFQFLHDKDLTKFYIRSAKDYWRTLTA
jgi:predicted nucleic acid-binding protein